MRAAFIPERNRSLFIYNHLTAGVSFYLCCNVQSWSIAQTCWQVKDTDRLSSMDAPCQSGASSVTWVQMWCTSSNTVTPAAAREHYTTYVGMETYYSLPHSTAPGKHTHTHTTTNTHTRAHFAERWNPVVLVKRWKSFIFQAWNS